VMGLRLVNGHKVFVSQIDGADRQHYP
jgi:hypothetical protein